MLRQRARVRGKPRSISKATQYIALQNHSLSREFGTIRTAYEPSSTAARSTWRHDAVHAFATALSASLVLVCAAGHDTVWAKVIFHSFHGKLQQLLCSLRVAALALPFKHPAHAQRRVNRSPPALQLCAAT